MYRVIVSCYQAMIIKTSSVNRPALALVLSQRFQFYPTSIIDLTIWSILRQITPTLITCHWAIS